MKPFSITTDLLPHQIDAVTKLLPSRVGGLYAEMGTGKSLAAIALAHRRAAKIDRVVWVTPTTLRSNVMAQIETHTDVPPEDTYAFGAATDCETVPLDRSWYVVGIEGLSSSHRVTLALQAILSERAFVIMDESTYIKGHRALRTQRLTLLSRHVRYRMTMTGTPYTQGPVDLYAQMKFLSPKILGYTSFYSFAANHLEFDVDRQTGRTTGRILRSHNVEYLAARIAPYVYQIRKSECLTLPDKLYESYWVEMTGEQRHAHEAAKDEALADEQTYLSPHIAILRLFARLEAIACGYRDGVPIAQHRIAGLVSLIEQIDPGEKILVYVKYRRGIEAIADALARAWGQDNVLTYHGGLSQAARAENVERWRNSARILILTQQSGGHGLTLTEASHTIFYATTWKYAERIQSEDRTHRIGQTKPCVYIDIGVRGSIDARIHEAVQTKGASLAGFQSAVDACKRKGLKAKLRAMIKAL